MANTNRNNNCSYLALGLHNTEGDTMSNQIIDIVVEYEGEHFTFTAEVDLENSIWSELVYRDNEAFAKTARSITVKPLTSIEGIADYLPDAAQQPVQQLTEADVLERQLWIQTAGEFDSDPIIHADKTVKAYRKFFNE